ncbi:MAG TPA: nuclear transport factor 2 family protein [Rhodopila sp.]
MDFINFFDTYKAAVLNKDVDALVDLYDTDLIAFDMWGSWSHIGEGPWRAMNQEWLGSLGLESVVVEFDDINTIPGNEVAATFATVTYKAVSETGEIVRSMQNRLTWMARLRNGSWKIVHQHTSAPIDRSTMRAILHR